MVTDWFDVVIFFGFFFTKLCTHQILPLKVFISANIHTMWNCNKLIKLLEQRTHLLRITVMKPCSSWIGIDLIRLIQRRFGSLELWPKQSFHRNVNHIHRHYIYFFNIFMLKSMNNKPRIVLLSWALGSFVFGSILWDMHIYKKKKTVP